MILHSQSNKATVSHNIRIYSFTFSPSDISKEARKPTYETFIFFKLPPKLQITAQTDYRTAYCGYLFTLLRKVRLCLRLGSFYSLVSLYPANKTLLDFRQQWDCSPVQMLQLSVRVLAFSAFLSFPNEMQLFYPFTPYI